MIRRAAARLPRPLRDALRRTRARYRSLRYRLARVDRGLRVNATDRPYHLGWILQAWCWREPAAEPTIRM